MTRALVPVSIGSEQSLSREVDGWLVTEAYFPPGLVIPEHRHQRPTVAVMLEGSFHCTFTHQHDLSCMTGALHTEPAEERHGNRIGSAGAHVVVIQPDPAACEFLAQRSRMLDRVNHVSSTPAVPLAWRLAAELHHRDTAALLAIEGLSLEVVAEAVRWTETGEEQKPAPWLRRAHEYIHASFRKPFRVADAAQAAGVGPVRLARAFRRHYGVSVASYVRRLRLEWAGLMLRTSEESLSSVAAQAGFADQSHFTRAFLRHAGVTPGRFRGLAPTA